MNLLEKLIKFGEFIVWFVLHNEVKKIHGFLSVKGPLFSSQLEI